MVRSLRALLVAVLFAAAAFAGCVSVDSGATVLPDPMAEPDVAFLSAPMTGCKHGGAVALYDKQWYGDMGPPAPFRIRDVSAEVGQPRFGAQGPLGGEMTGHWHMTIACDGATLSGTSLGAFAYGWVGIAIESPPWDDSGITRQYFASDLSLPAGALFDALQGAGIEHVSKTLGAKLEWLAGDVLHQVLDDEVHGVYEVHGAMEKGTTSAAETVRFWSLVPIGDAAGHDHGAGIGQEKEAGVKFRPVSVDLVATGDAVTHWTSVDSSAWFTHTRTKHHEPLPWGAGNVAAVAWSAHDIELRTGPQPDVVFDTTWKH